MLNVALLKKVKAHILEEPRRFIMEDWMLTGRPGKPAEVYKDLKRNIPACGTTACINGWACLLGSSEKVSWNDMIYTGPILLGIPGIDNNWELPQQTKELFHLENWPESFKEQWKKTRSLKGRAEIAGRRIDAYIRKYGPKKHAK